MKGVLIAIDEIDGRSAAARMVDGRLDQLAIDPPEDSGPVSGAILRARVGRPVKGLGGVFLDLPDGHRGFLRQTRGLAPGRAVLVQVTGPAEDGKAIPVTTRLVIKGRFAILTPEVGGLNVSRAVREPEDRARLEALGAKAMAGAPEGLGLILRSAAEDAATDQEAAEEIADLREITTRILADADGPPELLLDGADARETAWREWTDLLVDQVEDRPGSFADTGVEEAIAALQAPRVALPDGASMWVEATRALVAVDVNSGPDTSPAAGLKAGIAAARELPRQLRLRGLGGQVVADFAPVPKKDRQILEQALRAAIRREGETVTVVGWTAMGLFEMQRRRDRLPLSRVLPPGWPE